MKKLYLATLLLSACNGILANNPIIRLANSQVLKKRLYAAQLDHFVNNTEIHEKLGNKQDSPLNLFLSVEKELDVYSENLPPAPAKSIIMQMYKQQIIETILEDHPKAIEELKQQGYLKHAFDLIKLLRE